MSTERSSFGLNSILPISYRTKAEAFAKCLQDKLRSLSGLEDTPDDKLDRGNDDNTVTPHGSLSKYSEEEIADSVFLQGPLAYKRRSIPERTEPPLTNGRFISSVVDKRGFSSDSEDSEPEDSRPENAVHRRVAELQTQNNAMKRLTSVNSVDSTTSWCSCEDPEEEDDEEVIDSFASQIKGSPTIHNPRMRNFKRKNSRNAKEAPSSAPAENDLFFDFDVECFSPANLEDDGDDGPDFDSARLDFLSEDIIMNGDDSKDASDTGQLRVKDLILTPPPSPVKQILQPGDIPFDCSLNETYHEETIARDKFENNLVTDAALIENINLSLTENPDVIENADEKDAVLPSRFEVALVDEELEKHETEINEKDVPNIHEEIPECVNNADVVQEEAQDLTDSDEVLNENDEEEVAAICAEALPDVEVSENLIVSDQDSGEVTSIVVTKCDDSESDGSVTPKMKLRRCSSLKTWKTPPGTPGSKKIVRFADALGLDLADIRTFLDEIPKIPRSAFEDLNCEPQPVLAPPPPTERTLLPMFQQPGMQMDFLQRVRQNNVSLESAILTDVSLLSISGIVRVRNLSFHKSVHVRYTKDSWTTFSDLQATYVPSSSDGFADNFSFTLYGHTLDIGNRLEFAIRYECGAGHFWDSNGGLNYVFQCLPRAPMPMFPPLGSSPVETWGKFY